MFAVNQPVLHSLFCVERPVIRTGEWLPAWTKTEVASESRRVTPCVRFTSDTQGNYKVGSILSSTLSLSQEVPEREEQDKTQHANSQHRKKTTNPPAASVRKQA